MLSPERDSGVDGAIGRIPMLAIMLWCAAEDLPFRPLLTRVRVMDDEYLKWKRAELAFEQQRQEMERRVHAKS